MSLIQFLTRIHFADRVLEDALPEAMRRAAAKRALLLVDADGQAGDNLARVEDALPPTADYAVFPELASIPSSDDLHAADSFYTEARCDCVIAMGGTTTISFARILAMTDLDRKARPVIAVPTSIAGVGLGPVPMLSLREVRRTAVPVAVLCDATLTMTRSARRLAAHGFDALTHCIEAYLATAYNPPADGIALEGIRRSALFLERAVRDPDDIDARRELLAVALNADLASGKGLGGVEALARAAEQECGLADMHGTLHAAVMRPVLQFNAPAVGDRYERILEALGSKNEVSIDDALKDMTGRLGLPERISAVSSQGLRLDHVANLAASDPANLTNPRHATSADYRALLEQAL